MKPYELKPKFKDILIQMNFIEKYGKLSNKFTMQRAGDAMAGPINVKEIKSVFEKVGYPVTFDTRERFFKIKRENIGDYTFGFHIKLKYGIVELIWTVWKNDELFVGGPWGRYSKELTNNEVNIKPPNYGSYEDLEEILKYAFEMYEEFKEILINS